MFVLTRAVGEGLVINSEVAVRVVSIEGDVVRLAFTTPDGVERMPASGCGPWRDLDRELRHPCNRPRAGVERARAHE